MNVWHFRLGGFCGPVIVGDVSFFKFSMMNPTIHTLTIYCSHSFARVKPFQRLKVRILLFVCLFFFKWSLANSASVCLLWNVSGCGNLSWALNSLARITVLGQTRTCSSFRFRNQCFGFLLSALKKLMSRFVHRDWWSRNASAFGLSGRTGTGATATTITFAEAHGSRIVG